MLPAPSDLPRWRRELYAACGAPNDRVSFLEPVWHGEPEVCRVVLYQVFPAWATSPLFWDEEQEQRQVTILGRPAPDPRFRVSLNPEALTWRQWKLYERFGSIAQPFWIVQGSTGGHKRQFNQVESRLLGALGLPTEAPLAGALPFAPVDSRVIRQLVPLDAMRMWSKARELYERTPDDFDAEERDALRKGSAQLSSWLGEQVGHAIDDVVTYRKRLHDVFDHRAGEDTDLDAVERAVEAEYAA